MNLDLWSFEVDQELFPNLGKEVNENTSSTHQEEVKHSNGHPNEWNGDVHDDQQQEVHELVSHLKQPVASKDQ